MHTYEETALNDIVHIKTKSALELPFSILHTLPPSTCNLRQMRFNQSRMPLALSHNFVGCRGRLIESLL